MKIAIYSGSFDPVTHGHLDVLERVSRIFDQVVVAVSSDNSGKKTYLTAHRVGTYPREY